MMATAPINILVVTGIFPPDIGGPATYVPNLSGELVKRGHKITVVTLSDSLGHDDRSYAYSVHRIRRSLAKPLRLMFTVLRILHAGRRAQVLYVNGLYLEAVVANFVLRKPLVQKIVGDWAWERATNKGWVLDSFEEFQTRRYGLKVEFVKALRSFCARRANTVIVPSRFLARVVSHWRVSEKKTAVIYNAVEECSSLLKAEGEDLSSFAGLRPFHTSLSTRIKVVTVGRLVPWKRIDRLIEALCECDEAGLVIVGDGPERGRLEALARQRQVDDRVYFAGERTKQETVALMAACDVFVLNSSYEGFPHVVLEAMSAGLPVIATAVGGTPELVRAGENGLLIAPDANGTLSKTLTKLVTSSEERQRLAAGAKQTMERFRQSAMIEATEAALRAFAN